jgi:hypothetical protein
MRPIVIIRPRLLSVLTFGFADGLTLWPFIILKKENARIIRHESIHIKQQVEMLIIFFYLWYVFEWLLKFIRYKKFEVSYRNLSFEKEAYSNENDLLYLNKRKKYSWTKYL